MSRELRSNLVICNGTIIITIDYEPRSAEYYDNEVIGLLLILNRNRPRNMSFKM